MTKRNPESGVAAKEVVFQAHAPSGHVFRIFRDGTTEGFPDGTIVINTWMAMLNLERGLRIQAINQSHIANQ